MTTEPGAAEPGLAGAPRGGSSSAARVLLLGTSAGVTLLLMAGMASGQQGPATETVVIPVNPITDESGVGPAVTAPSGAAVSRPPRPAAARAAVPRPTAPRVTPRSAPAAARRAAVPAAPRATPKPPPPAPRVTPAPPRTPDTRSHAS